MQAIKERAGSLAGFLKGDIWRASPDDLTGPQTFLLRQIRILVLTFTGFQRDNCPMRASALTFYTLLSVVPVVAMAFGVAQGFGFENLLEKQLYERLPGQEEAVSKIVAFARSYLENTRGSMIAGIGVAVLFWAVIKVLSHIEAAFNHIWKIDQARSFARKFADYLSIMLICPLLIIVASSATVFITTHITRIVEQIALLGKISVVIYMLLKLLPYGLIWLLFTTVYLLMPNTRVSLRSGLLAGIIAGTIYHLAQWAYIYFQVEIANYNAIYGSFAALPLFLLWLQISWMIVLLGAEFSCAHQNVDRYGPGIGDPSANPRRRKLTALEACRVITRRFADAKPAATADEIAGEIGVPGRQVRPILADLVAGEVLCVSRDDGNGPGRYLPARDIGLISVQAVLDALETAGDGDDPPAGNESVHRLAEVLDAFADTARRSPANRLVKDL